MKNKLMNKDVIFSIICLILIIILFMIPTGFERDIYINAEHAKIKIINVDNSRLHKVGLVNQGSQFFMVEVLNGQFKGQQIEAINYLTGSISRDKVFQTNDIAIALLEKDTDNKLILATVIDYYRINIELILIGIFATILILVSGVTGLRTIISFGFTLTCIFKLFIPLLLKGYPPIILAFIIGICISVVTLILVAGFTKKACCGLVGTILASLITCFLAILFGYLFKVNGTVLEWSESLLYAGYSHLNLTAIYQSGIYLSCLGAIIDLSIDISSAIEELVATKPDIKRAEIFRSGMNIGKSIIGTQTTTLLLAYMGSFIAVIMVYIVQGTPLLSILNTQFISSEILQTFVGCIGLVLVSPLTVITCCYIYKN